MIKLFGFGPAFGLPDPSPFVLKTEVQLKMAGLAYIKERAAPQAAPKGKIPFIEDGGNRIGDSTYIRQHIEQTYRFDFDAGLCTAGRAQAWAIERMLEDHLYFAMIQMRWMDDANFAKGPAHFFDGAPAGTREAVREHVREELRAQGFGRHSSAEIAELGGRSLATLSVLLGDKPYLMGDQACGADATLFAMVAAVLTPFFEGELRRLAERHGNLAAYRDRMLEQYFPLAARAAA